MNILRNIDSSFRISSKEQLYIISNTWIYPYVSDISIYLVNPETMDKICPPERRRGIRRDRAKGVSNIIDEFLSKAPSEKWFEEFDEVFSRIDHYSSNIDCLGVFIPHAITLEEQKIEGPAVYISPEKLIPYATQISGDTGIDKDKVFRGLLRSIALHELTHALSWKLSHGKTYSEYRKTFIRILEETYAQYAVYPNLSRLDRIVFTKLSEQQPIEYNTWKALTTSVKEIDWFNSYILVYLWASYLVQGNQPPPHIVGLLIPPTSIHRGLIHYPFIALYDLLHWRIYYLDLKHKDIIPYDHFIGMLLRFTRSLKDEKQIIYTWLKLTTLILLRLAI